SGSLATIEGRVNERLQDNLEVTDRTMPIDEARALGAMALFGEKYGNIVRVASQVLGGGGGGKDDVAQGGGQDATQVRAALEAIVAAVPA
ncbi:MAG: hypothetical protein J0I40_04045, partial [Cellulomonas sp.]|nr:hypothetical protein [Cellulomonas sp.]